VVFSEKNYNISHSFVFRKLLVATLKSWWKNFIGMNRLCLYLPKKKLVIVGSRTLFTNRVNLRVTTSQYDCVTYKTANILLHAKVAVQ